MYEATFDHLKKKTRKNKIEEVIMEIETTDRQNMELQTYINDIEIEIEEVEDEIFQIKDSIHRLKMKNLKHQKKLNMEK